MLKNSWRITKYNPALRNDEGFYIPDEWTFYAQIGSTIGGRLFTSTEYEHMENLYVQAIIVFLDDLQLEGLYVAKWRCHNLNVTLENLGIDNLKTFLEDVQPQVLLDRGIVQKMARLALRELVDFEFMYPDVMRVTFGWDYYLYVYACMPCQKARKIIVESGLFVEEFCPRY